MPAFSIILIVSGSFNIFCIVFIEGISKYQDDGWQIAVHTQGDAAIREVLDAFETVGDEDADYRHRLEHCLLLENESIIRMHELNIHPSFHINHLYYFG